MKSILSGMAYLHEIGIVHRDIKLDNIMMTLERPDQSDDNAVPKIIDFGLAAVITPSEKRSEAFGTVAYCSPEIIARKSY